LSIDEIEIDMEELEDDRRRNEEARRRFLNAYAEWLRIKGIVKHSGGAPKSAKNARRPRL